MLVAAPEFYYNLKIHNMNRRSFLGLTAAAGSSLAFSGFAKRAEVLANSRNLSHLKAVGYGKFAPAVTKNTGETLLALPPGFAYKVFGKVGSEMTDKNKTPPAHDGMATFQMKNEIRIIRNHEVANRTPNLQSVIGANPYDEAAGGGTTTLVINPKTNEIIRDFVSLSGTLVNCAGGATPWGSWISCEETTRGQTKFTDTIGREVGGFSKPHGYCFEVFASANSAVTPVPLKAMGRFIHEAVAVDKKSGVVYLTEDIGSAGFYRFLPKRNKRLAEGGTLQILKIKNRDNYDTRAGQKPNVKLAANWVTIDNPDPLEADTDSLAVFKQGAAKGAASFSRLEGAFTDEKGRIYFVSTSGGDNKGGQIWVYEPSGRDEGNLMMVFESPAREILDMPDNICLHPKSKNIFICEDSDYVGTDGTRDNFMRVLTPSGKIADFAKNIVPNFPGSEFAGSTFSRDGKTLFVNVQTAGLTFAIWGDWSRFKS